LGMGIHLSRLVAAHPSRFEQICVISTALQDRPAAAHLDRPEKNRAGPRPCSENANPLNLTLSLRLEFLLLIETAAALRRLVLPRLGPRGHRRCKIASPLDLATSTLADLPWLVTEK
jgi:hypothetical protein